MYKYDTQWAPERNTKLIPLVPALILALSPGEEFTIPQKPLIYFLPTQQQQTLTYFLSNVKYHCEAGYREMGRGGGCSTQGGYWAEKGVLRGLLSLNGRT